MAKKHRGFVLSPKLAISVFVAYPADRNAARNPYVS